MASHFHVQHTFDIREVSKLLANVYAEYYKTANLVIAKYGLDEHTDIRVATLKIMAESILQFQIQGIFLQENLTKPDWWKEHFKIEEKEQHNIIDNQITHFNQEIVEGIFQMLVLRLESFIKTVYNYFSEEPYISDSIDISKIGQEVISKCEVSKDYFNLLQIINNIRHVINNDGFFRYDDVDIYFKDKEFLFTKDSILPVEYVTWNYIEFYLLQSKNFILDIIKSENISKIDEITNPSLHINFVNSSEVYKATEEEVNQAITILKSIDLKTAEDKKAIVDEISKIGYIPYLITRLPPGKPVYRARPNNGGEFGIVKDLSYVPPEKNRIYKRASTPDNTMFYGAIRSEKEDGLMSISENVVLLCEASKLYRNRDIIEEDTELLTFGRWILTKEIPIISIIQHEGFKDESEWLKNFRTDYKRFIRQFPTIRNQIIKITNFIADEFAKPVEDEENFNYKISAVFTEHILNNAKSNGLNIGGVLYPSRQAEGSGLCVAIHPDWVNECMELEGVLEIKVHKKSKNILSNNLRMCNVEKNSDNFSLLDIPIGKYRSSEEEIQKILNGEIKLEGMD